MLVTFIRAVFEPGTMEIDCLVAWYNGSNANRLANTQLSQLALGQLHNLLKQELDSILKRGFLIGW